MCMRKEYINPTVKTLDVNEESLLISVSTGDNTTLNVSDGEGDASEALGKSTNVWED